MPLFRCDKCGCVENTALGFYWTRNERELWAAEFIGRKLCSEHAPTTFRDGSPNDDAGKWHGRFPKRPATGMLVDQEGFLWQTDELLPTHYRIVGVMQEDGTVKPR